MPFFKGARSAVCVAALVAGNAAIADVTAQEVWDNWKAQMNVYGQDGITIGSEDYSGGVLTVTDMGVNIDDGETVVSANMANITFTENGDGTVTVTYSEEYPIRFSKTASPDKDHVSILMKSTGNEMTVSGTADEMNYALRADRYTVSVTEALENGEPMPVEGAINLNDISGSYVVNTGDSLRDMTYDMAAASLDVLLGLQNGTDRFDMSGQVANLQMAGSMSMPLDYDPATPETMFADGFAVDGIYTAGLTNYIINATDATGPTNITGTSSGAKFGMAMDREALSFEIAQNDLALNVVSNQMPFPVDLTAKEIGFDIAMPMAKTDEPTDFSTAINLVEVGTNDMIWSMADPTGAFPHDPITAQVDLSGTGKLFFDLTDPEQATQMESGAVPGELNSLKLNMLNLILAGATVTGTGDFTFDNTDLVTFGGFPRPQGSLDLLAKGVNGLLDKLQTVGLVPEDQMMGARMMLGMFATVVGEDELSSKLEVNETGGVFLNGQQIR